MRRILALLGLTGIVGITNNSNATVSGTEVSVDTAGCEAWCPGQADLFTAEDHNTCRNCEGVSVGGGGVISGYAVGSSNTVNSPNSHGVYSYIAHKLIVQCGERGNNSHIEGMEVADLMGSAECEETIEYACGRGYYGTATSENSGCHKCPVPSGISDSTYVTSTGGNGTDVKDCYLKSGALFSNAYGEYQIVADCGNWDSYSYSY